MPKQPNLIGEKFGRLVVIKSIRGPIGPLWECECACGGSATLSTNRLRSGNTSSCGCLRADRRIEVQTTHGKTGTPEYRIWSSMKARCLNKNRNSYPRYGGRGIKVCQRWLNSFENFFADMGPRPTPKHSIDRKRNSHGYSPSNCRWATSKEQNLNTDANVVMWLDGEKTKVPDASEKMGVPYGTLIWFLKKMARMEAPLAKYKGFKIRLKITPTKF